MQKWITEELESSDIGDERLDDRFKIILDRFSQKPSVSIPAACDGWSETIAAYRFFDNARVDYQEVLAPHHDASLKRIAKHDVVLLVQDTTEIDLTRRNEKVDGGGPLNDESRVGLFDHAMLALTPERIPLGLVDANIWARDWEAFRKHRGDKKAKKKAQRYKPIEEKESFRWLDGYRQGCAIAEQVPDTQLVVISDSEGDVFECFTEAEQDVVEKAEWLVRACQNRKVDESHEHTKLWDEVSSTEILGTMEVQVSKNHPKSTDKKKRNQARSARTAKMTIQATTVTLKGPWRPGRTLPNKKVNVVLVRELHPPKGEKPVEWLLLTSLPIDTFEKICQVINYYCCRWQIEIYFRILKSGCKVEDLQLETADRFSPCLAMYMIVAWRVMYLLMMGRECPNMPCDRVFADDEWKAVYTISKQETPPKTPPKLQDIVNMIANLGGYLGRTHDGPPGPKTMWIGMQRMSDLALAWRTFGPAKTPTRKRKIRV